MTFLMRRRTTLLISRVVRELVHVVMTFLMRRRTTLWTTLRTTLLTSSVACDAGLFARSSGGIEPLLALPRTDLALGRKLADRQRDHDGARCQLSRNGWIDVSQMTC